VIEQQLDALARGELALGVLRRDPLLPAAQQRAGASTFQSVEHRFQGRAPGRVAQAARRNGGRATRSAVVAGFAPAMGGKRVEWRL
jgi:hypothetical protein